MIHEVLLLDNYDSFSYNLVDFFEQAGASVQVEKNSVTVEKVLSVSADLLVISPGPSTPSNAGNLMKILEACSENIPIFGVCLGLEALVEFFGGSLRFVEPVHGKSSDIHHDGAGIFEGLENPFEAGRYHSLATDQVPDCFEVSAHYKEKNDESLVMALRHKTLPIEAVQFHPESVLSFRNDQGMKLIQNVVHHF